MNDYKDKPPAPPIDLADLSFQKPLACDDGYYTRGVDFPLPDSTKGIEAGPENLTGGQSDKQKSPRQNAQDGPNQPTVKGKEGQAFPPAANSKDSKDESQTFQGQRSDVSVSFVSGQIVSGGKDIKGNKI